MASLRAHFDGRVLIPVGPVDLPTDRELEIEVTDPSARRQALLSALESLPTLAAEDVELLEQSIDQSKLPLGDGNPFDTPENQ